MLSGKNIALCLLGLGCVGLGGLAWEQQREMSRMRAAFASQASELLKARESAARLKSQARAESARAESVDAAAGAAEASQRAPWETRNGRKWFEARRAALRELAKKPEYRQARQALGRGSVESRYAALFAKLKLSPEAAEKLKTLLADRRAAESDAREIAREQGLWGPENREKLQAVVAAAQAEVDNSILAAIGAEAYAEYQYYEQTLGARGVVNQLESRLQYSESPLSAAQAEQLVSAMAAGGTAQSVPGPMGGAAITEGLLQQAQGVLSAEQIAALQQLKTEQEAQRKLAELHRQAGEPPGER